MTSSTTYSEELLVLRKTLTELLDKNFIRVSNSPAAVADV